MSIRIQNDQTTDIASSQAGRSEHVQGSTGSGSSKTSGFSGIGGDRVEVSSITESISAGISQTNIDRATRVSNLTALYTGGRYDADAGRVSQSIVSNAISASAAGQA